MSVEPLQDRLAATSLDLGSPPLIRTERSTFDTEPLSSSTGQFELDPNSDNEEEEEANGDRDEGTAGKGGANSNISEPRFFPPLWLARRTFIYEKLKEQGIKSVADLGCGEGSLLSLLSVPAYHVDDFPSLYPPSTPAPPSVPSSCVSNSSNFPLDSSPLPSKVSARPDSQSKSDKLNVLRSIPRPDPSHSELHLRKLVGIDSDSKACQVAKQVIKPERPMQEPQERWIAPEFRFEELTSQVFNGNLEVFNQCLEDCEALVLTEVIEHMTASAFAKLPNLLFNVYSPRLIIITTPNHAFNPYFPPTSTSDSPTSTRCPDPSERTSPRRIFRDPTHLFEFTPEEFKIWCRDALKQTGSTDEYDLEFTGVGSLSSYYGSSAEKKKNVPFPPPSISLHPALHNDPYSTNPISRPQEFYATQIAIFKKKFSNESERSPRSARPVPLPFFSPPLSSTSLPLEPNSTTNTKGEEGLPLQIPHRLIGCYVHKPRKESITYSREEVFREVKKIFNSNAEAEEEEAESSEGGIGWLNLSEIWRIGGLPSTTTITTTGDIPEGEEYDDDEGNKTSSARKPCLREMVGGETGTLINYLLDEDEQDEENDWIFERVEKDTNGRKLQGIEAMKIGWRRWEGRKEEELEDDGEVERRGESDGLRFDGLTENGGGDGWGRSIQEARPESSNRVEAQTEGQSGTPAHSNGVVAEFVEEVRGNPETGGWNDEW